MKQLINKNKKLCIIAIIAIVIIIIGIIVIATKGFNKELKYSQTQSIDIYVEQEVDRDKIKDIANEVLGKENMIEVIEIYQDLVNIRAKNISDEQKDTIISKIKENYEFSQTSENTTIKTVPETRIKDMYKKYIIPFVISAILVLIYITIRYYKKGIVNTITRTIMIPIISELVLLSIMAIIRFPIGRFTPVLFTVVYIISVIFTINKIEKLEDKNVSE